MQVLHSHLCARCSGSCAACWLTRDRERHSCRSVYRSLVQLTSPLTQDDFAARPNYQPIRYCRLCGPALPSNDHHSGETYLGTITTNPLKFRGRSRPYQATVGVNAFVSGVYITEAEGLILSLCPGPYCLLI